MNLNQVQYMLAIYETGSIRQAAENLFVSAPSVSTAIKNLEEELGCSLLMRHHNGVTFTEEGEDAIRLMKELEEIVNKLHHLKQDVSIAGEVTIGVSLHVKASLFLPTRLWLQSTYPEINVKNTDARSRDILQAVIQGNLNLGLIHYSDVDKDYFEDAIVRNELTFSKLNEGEMIFVVHEDHPLTKETQIGMAELLQYPFLNYYKTDFTKAHHKILQRYNPNYQLIQPDDRDMYRDLLHDSNAVTIMPAFNAISDVKQFAGLTFLRVSDFALPYVIGWLHNSDPLTRVERIVVDALEQEAARCRA